MKNKFWYTIACGTLIGLIGFSACWGTMVTKTPQPVEPTSVIITATPEPTPTPEPTARPIPVYDPVCNGIDISGMTKDEVFELVMEDVNPIDAEKTVRQLVFGAYDSLPYSMREKFPIADIIIVDDEFFTYGASKNSNAGYTLFIGSYTEDVAFDTYAAIGDLIDKACGNISERQEWLKIWNEECKDEFRYTGNATESFAYQFADYAMQSYSGCWNSIHTPVMYSYMDYIYNNFDEFYIKGLDMKKQQTMREYTYRVYVEYCRERWRTYSGNDQARLEAAKALLPDSIEEFIKEEQLVWKIVDELNWQGENYAGIIHYNTPTSGNEYTTVYILKDYVAMEATTAHEVGHYVDHYLLHTTGQDVREEFVDIIKSEYDSSILYSYGMFDEDEVGEYFADSFAYCVSDCEELRDYYKTYCPKTYEFVWDTINQLEEIYKTGKSIEK